MPEDLVPGDVEQYTRGALLQTDPETVRALNAALARVRRYCGWHVSPVRTETVTMDRPPCNSQFLILPTLKIVNPSTISITVDGVAVDPANIRASSDAPGVLSLRNLDPWGGYRWDSGFGLVEVTFTHGFTAIEAEDFRGAVLDLIYKAQQAISSGGAGPLVEKEVDDVRYKWASVSAAVESTTTPLDKSILDKYRILPIA